MLPLVKFRRHTLGHSAVVDEISLYYYVYCIFLRLVHCYIWILQEHCFLSSYRVIPPCSYPATPPQLPPIQILWIPAILILAEEQGGQDLQIADPYPIA